MPFACSRSQSALFSQCRGFSTRTSNPTRSACRMSTKRCKLTPSTATRCCSAPLCTPPSLTAHTMTHGPCSAKLQQLKYAPLPPYSRASCVLVLFVLSPDYCDDFSPFYEFCGSAYYSLTRASRARPTALILSLPCFCGKNWPARGTLLLQSKLKRK